VASVEPTKFTIDAKGKKRATRDSKWVARWRSPEGASREKVFDRKVDAEQHLTAVEHTKLAGSYVDPRAGKVTFRSYAERWRVSQVHRAATAAQIEKNLRLHVYPRIGERPIGSIRPSEIQALVKSLTVDTEDRKGLSPATVEIVFVWLSTVFKAAVVDRVIPVTPCQQIALPVVEEKHVTPLPAETVVKLIDAVPDRYRALIVLGAGSGMRISEALGLTKDRVDWPRRTVTVNRQLVGIDGDSPVFGPVKNTKNRPRTIPLPEVVLLELSAHLARFGEGPDGLMFTGPRGRPLRRSTFSQVWSSAAAPLGIPGGDGYHTLRHFYASVLIRAGESVKVVQERLGHTSAQMTLDIYSHLWPEDEDRTREAVTAALLGTRTTPQEPHTTSETSAN
jgi:integrase